MKKSTYKKSRINKKLASKPKTANTKKYLLVGIGLVILILGAVLVFRSFAGTGKYNYDPATKKVTGRPYSADSPINQTIPGDVKYLTDSSARIGAISANANVGLITWALPIYDVDSNTPKSIIFCRLYSSFENSFASLCPNISKQPVPIPANAVPQIGGDNHLLVVDSAARQAYDYWGWKDCSFVINFIQANYCPLTGGVANIDGNGVGGGGTASEIAPTGGVIRTYEVEEGAIEHALLLTTPSTCFSANAPKDSVNTQFVYPALHTDGGVAGGSSNQATCLQMGQRIQLPPSVDLTKITFNSPFEKMVATALQKYGAYVSDTSGSMSFYAEYDRTGRNVYQKAGVPAGTDAYFLKNIPWANAKIIDPQWKSDGSKAYNWGGSGTSGGVPPTTTVTVGGTTTNPSPTPTPTPVQNPIPTPVPSPEPVPMPSAPLPPTNLVATGIFDSSVILGWGQSLNGAVGYNLFMDGKQIASTPTLGFTVQGLAANSSHIFEVNAYNSTGQVSAKSNKLTITTKNGCFLFYCW